MPGYRLTFGTLDMRAVTIEDGLLAANNTLGEVVGPIAEHAEIIGQDFLTSRHGVNQFVIRFTAADDATAYAVAEAAIKAVRLPVDSIALDRRSSRYVPVEAGV